MRRVKLVIQYDGKNYSGWQRQSGFMTVQGELEKALKQVTQEEIVTYAASRTDAGVHALGQTVHFDDSGKFAVEEYTGALNALLPDDIGVISALPVEPTFHARFDSKKKWYRYQIYNGKEKPIFKKETSFFYSAPINIEEMRQGASYLVGEHDFCAFKTLTEDNEEQNSVRTLYSIQVQPENQMIYIDVEGNGFLYKMVRCLVGTLFEVGRGKYPSPWVKKVLEAKNRQMAGPNMPPQGLFLMKVFY